MICGVCCLLKTVAREYDLKYSFESVSYLYKFNNKIQGT